MARACSAVSVPAAIARRSPAVSDGARPTTEPAAASEVYTAPRVASIRQNPHAVDDAYRAHFTPSRSTLSRTVSRDWSYSALVAAAISEASGSFVVSAHLPVIANASASGRTAGSGTNSAGSSVVGCSA